MMTIPDDPYFAGCVVDKTEQGEGKRHASGERPPVVAWTVVFITNLFVPVYFGFMVTREAGMFGMLLGVALYFALGCYLCYVAREVVRTVVYGGRVVAIAQLLPFGQFIAGMIGLGSAHALGQATDSGLGVTSEAGGFIATLVTRGLLLTVAAVFGLVIRWIMSRGRA